MRKHYLDSTLVCALSAISFCFNIDQAIGKKPAAEKNGQFSQLPLKFEKVKRYGR